MKIIILAEGENEVDASYALNGYLSGVLKYEDCFSYIDIINDIQIAQMRYPTKSQKHNDSLSKTVKKEKE